MTFLPQIIEVESVGRFALKVTFADGSHGVWRPPAESWRGPMAEPVRTPEGFAEAFVDMGALAWPNGYDASPEAIWDDLKAAGELKAPNYAAE